MVHLRNSFNNNSSNVRMNSVSRNDTGEDFCTISTFFGVWEWTKAQREVISLSHGDQINIAPETLLAHSHTHSPFAVCVKVISQTQLRNCYLYSSQAAEYPVQGYIEGKLKRVLPRSPGSLAGENGKKLYTHTHIYIYPSSFYINFWNAMLIRGMCCGKKREFASNLRTSYPVYVTDFSNDIALHLNSTIEY